MAATSSADLGGLYSDHISQAKIWQVIGASAVGTMIEWYDFYIFGSLAPIISPSHAKLAKHAKDDGEKHSDHFFYVRACELCENTSLKDCSQLAGFRP